MNKLLLALFTASLLLGISSNKTSALSLDYARQVKDRMTPRSVDRVATLSGQKAENICRAINTRISTHLNNLEVRKDNHIEIYQAAHQRWIDLVTRLKAQGYNTTKLETDLATLSTMTAELKEEYDEYVSLTKTTLGIDCLQSASQFKESLNKSKQQLAVFRSKAKAVHAYIQTVIRADLRALRQQKPTITPTPTTNQ